MKNYKLLYTVIVLLIIINVGFIVQFNFNEGPHHLPHPSRPPKYELVNYLKVEGKTRAFILAEQEKHFSRKTSLIDAHRTAQRKLIFTYLESIDSVTFHNQFQRITDIQYAIELENHRYFYLISQHLNPAQKVKLKTFLQAIFQKPKPPKRPR